MSPPLDEAGLRNICDEVYANEKSINQGVIWVDTRANSVRDYARDALRGGLIAHLHDPAVQGKWFDFCEAVAMCAFDIGEAMANEEEKREKRNEEAE